MIDTYDLLATLGMNPPGIEYIWGYSQIQGTGWMYKTNVKEGEEETLEEAAPGPMFGGSGTTMAFTNGIYTYTTSEQLPPGLTMSQSRPCPRMSRSWIPRYPALWKSC